MTRCSMSIDGFNSTINFNWYRMSIIYSHRTWFMNIFNMICTYPFCEIYLYIFSVDWICSKFDQLILIIPEKSEKCEWKQNKILAKFTSRYSQSIFGKMLWFHLSGSSVLNWLQNNSFARYKLNSIQKKISNFLIEVQCVMLAYCSQSSQNIPLNYILPFLFNAFPSEIHSLSKLNVCWKFREFKLFLVSSRFPKYQKYQLQLLYYSLSSFVIGSTQYLNK